MADGAKKVLAVILAAIGIVLLIAAAICGFILMGYLMIAGAGGIILGLIKMVETSGSSGLSTMLIGVLKLALFIAACFGISVVMENDSW